MSVIINSDVRSTSPEPGMVLGALLAVSFRVLIGTR